MKQLITKINNNLNLQKKLKQIRKIWNKKKYKKITNKIIKILKKIIQKHNNSPIK